MATKLDDAKLCPRCKLPGEETAKIPTRKRGTYALHMMCRNERCKWFNTGWLVQVNPDGTVPDPVDHKQSREPGFFQNLGRPDPALARRIEHIAENQLEQETQPGGGEISNPRAGK